MTFDHDAHLALSSMHKPVKVSVPRKSAHLERVRADKAGKISKLSILCALSLCGLVTGCVYFVAPLLPLSLTA